ncbi:MAG: D-alanyl-D-alanine carboxypeptidase [Ruminococcus sp.]|nr:D-alanyl-D-alanine carboxypeptidase [Ruminococcus sp.]
MKKILSLLISLTLCAVSSLCVFASDDVQVSASAFVLYCVDNSQVLLGRNEHTKMGMASTTKIMTALLTLEEAERADRVVEFTAEMTAEGSSMYLKKGDKVRLSDLAAGMMTVSGNDAANAAAIAIGTSKEGFAKLMNERAEAIGMKNTHFVTPSGLSDSEHYSTAYDMALLMNEAMKNEAFSELTSKSSVTVDFVYPQDQQVTYNNHNRLLKDYDYCTGGKTGYTISTGRCLVTSACHDGLTLIAVTLNDRNDWADHKALYEYGFSTYKAIGDFDDVTYNVKVAGALKESVRVRAEQTKKAVVKTEEAERIRCRVYLTPLVFAPVKKGDVLGCAVYTSDSKTVLKYNLVAQESTDYKECNKLVRFFYQLFR